MMNRPSSVNVSLSAIQNGLSMLGVQMINKIDGWHLVMYSLSNCIVVTTNRSGIKFMVFVSAIVIQSIKPVVFDVKTLWAVLKAAVSSQLVLVQHGLFVSVFTEGTSLHLKGVEDASNTHHKNLQLVAPLIRIEISCSLLKIALAKAETVLLNQVNQLNLNYVFVNVKTSSIEMFAVDRNRLSYVIVNLSITTIHTNSFCFSLPLNTVQELIRFLSCAKDSAVLSANANVLQLHTRFGLMQCCFGQVRHPEVGLILQSAACFCAYVEGVQLKNAVVYVKALPGPIVRSLRLIQTAKHIHVRSLNSYHEKAEVAVAAQGKNGCVIDVCVSLNDLLDFLKDLSSSLVKICYIRQTQCLLMQESVGCLTHKYVFSTM